MCHQALTCHRVHRDDDRLGDRGMPAQHNLDLRRLDPVAIQLDLVVQSATIVKYTIAGIPHAIASAIPALTALFGKALGGQFGAMDISGSEAIATEQQLAFGITGYIIPLRIDHAHTDVRQRASDRRQLRPVRRITRQLMRGNHMRFGRSVVVMQHAAGQRAA